MVSTINIYSFVQYSKNLRLLRLCCMFPAATETVVIAVAVLLCILIVTIGALAGFRFWIRTRRNYAEFSDDHDSRCKQLNDVHKSIMQFCHKVIGVELLLASSSLPINLFASCLPVRISCEGPTTTAKS